MTTNPNRPTSLSLDVYETDRPTQLPPDAPTRPSRLTAIHDYFRTELDTLRRNLQQPVTVTSLTYGRQRLHQLRALVDNGTAAPCQRFCYGLTLHHEREDGELFPELRATDTTLAPVLDRLAREHDLIREAIAHLDSLLCALASDPSARNRLHDALDTFTATLDSHFRYEERELGHAVNALYEE